MGRLYVSGLVRGGLAGSMAAIRGGQIDSREALIEEDLSVNIWEGISRLCKFKGGLQTQ